MFVWSLTLKQLVKFGKLWQNKTEELKVQLYYCVCQISINMP